MEEFDLKFLERMAYARGLRNDALTNFTAYSRDQLMQSVAGALETQYSDLTARNFVPLLGGIDPRAQAFSYDIYAGRGKARFIGGNVNDLPRVDIDKRRVSFSFKTIGTSYSYTIEEMMSASFAGLPLDQRRAAVARRAMAELENELLLTGSEPEGLLGLLNNPAVPVMTVPNGDWEGTATADDIVADLNAIGSFNWNLTDQYYQATTLVLPPSRFRSIAQMRLGENLTDTVRNFWLATNGGVTRIEMMRELETAGPGGAPRALIYDPDPSKVAGLIPMPLDVLPPQEHGFETVIHMWEKIGGVIFFEPFSAAYVDGI